MRTALSRLGWISFDCRLCHLITHFSIYARLHRRKNERAIADYFYLFLIIIFDIAADFDTLTVAG